LTILIDVVHDYVFSNCSFVFLLADVSRIPSGRIMNDAALKKRAKAVLASLTHLDNSYLPDEFPQFFDHGEGCRVTDVDGKT
jgi:4-aminobutyrate aminotransferase-like enzyme